ncbi:MAG: GNAT family N-acetyltransferase [Proteobacteria bacterium]|nr:GNAT family N-acetyltransferase [Pseudomonadota bacterium]
MIVFERFARNMLETERLIIKHLQPQEAHLVARFENENRDFMAEFSPTRPDNFYSTEYWEARLTDYSKKSTEDALYGFFVFRKSDGSLIGCINFTNIVRGALQACHLGYNLSRKAEGEGLMTEALRASIAYMFKEKNLHRIMANYYPTNEKSGRVLEKLGFQREGLAKDYLFLNGAWRDHVMTSLINPDWRQ